ncbi:hypothetical protein D3C75_651010 [compost metagenome]
MNDHQQPSGFRLRSLEIHRPEERTCFQIQTLLRFQSPCRKHRFALRFRRQSLHFQLHLRCRFDAIVSLPPFAALPAVPQPQRIVMLHQFLYRLLQNLRVHTGRCLQQH